MHSVSVRMLTAMISGQVLVGAVELNFVGIDRTFEVRLALTQDKGYV